MIRVVKGELISVPFFAADSIESLPSGRKHLQDDRLNVPLENIDIAYLIDMAIGTPPQPFTLLLDTGSSSSWVSAYGCGRYCGNPARTLLPSNSSTFASTSMVFSATYGEGYAHGLFAQDTFTVHNASVPDAYFGLIFANDGQLAQVGADGILGLGPDALTKFSNPEAKIFPTLVTSMYDQGIIPNNMFSIYFHPLTANTSRINGEITFGGVNTMHARDEIVYTPLTKDEHLHNYWATDLDGISIGNQSVAENMVALIDTGSTLIYLPNDIIQQLFDGVDAFMRNGYYVVPCQSDQLKSITFHINGAALVLNPEDYVIQQKSTSCRTYFMDSPSGFGILLGYGFLQQFVTVFDNDAEQIGFSHRL